LSVDNVIRQRDRIFLAHVRGGDFPLTDEATPENVEIARRIARAVWPSIGEWMSDVNVLKKVRSKLRQPDVRRALGDAFAVVGFTPDEALALHVAHIRGFPRQVQTGVDEDGNAILETVMEKPNYPALKDYQAMVLPKAVEERRVRVDSRQLNVHVDGGNAGESVIRVGPPPTRSRMLGDVSVTAALDGNE
jgi:hypothetical protein